MNFLKENARDLWLALLFWLIFLTIFYLYGLPLSAAVYPLLLCTVIFLVVKLTDYRRRERRIKALEALKKVEDAPLPHPENTLEAAYIQVIESKERRLKAERSQNRERSKESEDTLALWIHQIKTPITSLKLMFDTGQGNTEMAAQLSRIDRYVGLILNYFRLQSENTDYVFCRVDLDTLIKETVKKFSSEFILRKNRIKLEPTGLKPVTDEKWLSFVLEQILSNALKYTKNGTIAVYGESSSLVIEDSGIGIKAGDLPRVFERGYTGYNGRNEKSASGLGLYLCKRVLTQLDSEIEVTSNPGEGTKVKIKF